MSNTTELKINAFAQDIKDWRESRQFFTPDSLDTIQLRDMMLGKLMLVVTEVSEAAEAVRHNDRENFIEEIADTYIRLMDITAAMGVDVEIAIKNKMAANHLRPIKHGKQCSL